MNNLKSSYIGRHAELYDLFYSDKPYAEEAHFVHECLQKYGHGTQTRLLELACGTGSHSFYLERYGYQIIAIDYSPDMLAQAIQKAGKAGSLIDFRHQDMRNLDIPEPPLDAALCLFDSIGYVKTNENVVQVFKEVNRHLREDGLFIFEFWHAGAMLKSYSPLRVRRWEIPGGQVLRISETIIDYINQLCQVTYTIFENAESGYSSFTETQINRFFLIQEMSMYLTIAGFTPLEWFSGFAENREIDSNTWHVVTVARKTQMEKG